VKKNNDTKALRLRLHKLDAIVSRGTSAEIDDVYIIKILQHNKRANSFAYAYAYLYNEPLDNIIINYSRTIY